MNSATESRPPIRQLLTLKEVAALFQISESWLRQHSSGKRQPTVKSVRLGSRYRYDPRDVMEFIEGMRNA